MQQQVMTRESREREAGFSNPGMAGPRYRQATVQAKAMQAADGFGRLAEMSARMDRSQVPVAAKTAGSPAGPVAQFQLTGSSILAGAASFGALGAAAGYNYGGYGGATLGLLGGGLLGGILGGVSGYIGARRQDPVADHGSFAANVAARPAFNAEMERRVNLGARTEGRKIIARDPRLRDAATHLNRREAAQRGHVNAALRSGKSLYGANPGGIAKDTLWRSMHGRIDAGTMKANAANAMSDEVKLKAKTSIAQIIATPEGEQLMQYVTQKSAQLGVPIEYVESAPGEGFNLQVAPQRNDPHDAAKLTGLKVVLPDNAKYNEGQSFKRVSDPVSGVSAKGSRLSVSPIDTDFFHEFVHAAHYLTFEERRRNGGAHLGDNPAMDIPAYDAKTMGFHRNLDQQDDVAEARTIHRTGSYGNLTRIAEAQAREHADEVDLVAMPDAMRHVGAVTAGTLSENDYRERLGLSPRQDHLALVANGKGGFVAGHRADIAVEE